MTDIEPGQVLRAARELVNRSNYAEALEKYLWFYEHALDHDPIRFYGVRLSYALDEWARLGEMYPPAHLELISVRDRKAKELAAGKLEYRLFHDVVSINEALGQVELTSALYKEVAALNVEFARKNLSLALDALMATRDFDVIRSIAGSPQGLLEEFLRQLNAAVKYGLLPDEAHSYEIAESFIDRYLEKTRQLLTVLVEVGERDEARRLGPIAIELIESAEIRERVRGKLKLP